MIHIKANSYTVRKYDEGSYELKSPYDGIMHVIHITDYICYIYGAKGDFTTKDYADIGEKLLELGFERCLMERHNKIKELDIKKGMCRYNEKLSKTTTI